MTVRVNKSAFNIREKLSELERPIGVKGNELMRAETAQEARDLVSAGRKNLIINGDFRISQRGNYTSNTSMTNATYYLDRWFSDHGATVTGTFRQITTDLPKEYRNLSNTGLRFEATSSNSSAYIGFRQRYEFMSGLEGKYVTVSAWVKSNRQAVLINYDGSGAPYDYAQHSGGGGWEYLSYTTFITSTSHDYFDVFIINPVTYGYMQINSGDYVEVTNYQVEIGKVATEFEHRSYGEELVLCQRYCQSFSGRIAQVNANSGTGGVGRIPLSPQMRTTPVIFSYIAGNLVREGVAWYPVTVASISSESTNNNFVFAISTGTTNTGLSVGDTTHWGNGATLILSAEL